MSTIVKPNEFSAGATIVASEHNSNFDTIYDDHNGSIANANIKSDAAIAMAKLTLAITNTQVAAGAGILGSKLNLNTPGVIGGTSTSNASFSAVVASSIELAAGATCTAIRDEDDMASDSAVALATQQSIKKYVDDSSPDVLSNVIFSWSGLDGASANTHGMYKGANATQDINGSAGGENIYLAVYGATLRSMLHFKFTKIAGIDDVTIHARIWADSAQAAEEGVVTVDIGGQNTTVSSTTSTSPTWYTSAADIDVSGLSDGTSYDGVVKLSNENASQNAYCSAVTLVAS